MPYASLACGSLHTRFFLVMSADINNLYRLYIASLYPCTNLSRRNIKAYRIQEGSNHAVVGKRKQVLNTRNLLPHKEAGSPQTPKIFISPAFRPAARKCDPVFPKPTLLVIVWLLLLHPSVECTAETQMLRSKNWIKCNRLRQGIPRAEASQY